MEAQDVARQLFEMTGAALAVKCPTCKRTYEDTQPTFYDMGKEFGEYLWTEVQYEFYNGLHDFIVKRGKA